MGRGLENAFKEVVSTVRHFKNAPKKTTGRQKDVSRNEG